MEYRTLGRTGERISAIGMGTWRIGTFTSEAEKAKEAALMKRGFELGMTFVDTAEMYSEGKAEEVVAEAIASIREEVFIATKVAPRNLRYGDVLAACDESLRRLDTRFIDLYQVHWPNPHVPIRETMRAMEKLIEEGKVRYIGVSNFSVRQTEEARESLARNELASNQVEYSLQTRDAEAEVLPYCEREKLTLIAYSPLARGNIDDSAVPPVIREKYAMTTAQVMLNWVTRSESVVAIPKAAEAAHLEENAASLSKRMTPGEYAKIAKD